MKKQVKRNWQTHQQYMVLSLAIALSLSSSGVAVAGTITPADAANSSKITQTIKDDGTRYEIEAQQFNGDRALNQFTDFQINKSDVANLHMGTANHLINVVKNKIDIDGVVNAIKDSKIGGNIYFFSDKGIVIGANGIINAGSIMLGANADHGEKLYKDGFEDRTAGEKLKYLGGSADSDSDITVSGQLNAANGNIEIYSNDVLKVNGNLKTGSVFNTPGSGWTAADYRSQLMNVSGVESAGQARQAANGDIMLLSGCDISVSGDKGTAANESGRLETAGGNITILADDYEKKGKIPEQIDVTVNDAYLSTKAKDANSGDISVQALRQSRCDATLNIKGSTFDASGAAGQQAGNVTVSTVAQGYTFSWAIGMGATADVTLDAGSLGQKNVLTGDNVSIGAYATTTNQNGTQADEEAATDDALKAALKQQSGVLGTLAGVGDSLGNLRLVASATKVHANAKVDIKNSDLVAVGGTKGDTADKKLAHGNLNLRADARSQVSTPFNIGLIGFGVTVGMSDADATLTVDQSTLNAARDIKAQASVDNRVDAALTMDLSLIQGVVPFGVDFSWAQVNSNAKTYFGKKATLTAGGDITADASSIRLLSSSAAHSATSEIAGAGVAVAKADTKAEAGIEGSVRADGAVKLNALNQVAQDTSGLYQMDTAIANSATGDSYMKPVVDKVKSWKVPTAIINFFTDLFSTGSAPKKISNKFGLSASTACLLSNNNANAYFTGDLRGKAGGLTAARSLAITADTLGRARVRAISYQNDATDKKEGSEQPARKDTGVALAVDYGQEENNAVAKLGGAVQVHESAEDAKKSIDAVLVRATNKIPYQTEWSPKDSVLTISKKILKDSLTSSNFGAANYVDSWSQAVGNGNDLSLSGSVGVMEYRNTAKALIMDNTKAVIEGNLAQQAKNDTTTVNFTGDIHDPLSETPLSIFVGDTKWSDYIKNSFTNPSKNAAGGAALAIHQKNVAESSVGSKASITTTKAVDISAKNEAKNVSIAAAGGNADSVAINGTVSVNRLDNTTTASVGESSQINAGQDFRLTAEDGSSIINIAGGVGISGGTGIGATIGYNHIKRNTKAVMSGQLTAGGNAEVSAENTGLIFTATAAGAVTHDKKKKDTGSGSPETPTTPDTDGMDPSDLTDTLLNQEGEEEVSADIGTDAVREAGKSAPELETVSNKVTDQGDSNKKGLAVAANIGVNRVIGSAQAQVEKAAQTAAAPSVTADALRISAADKSRIDALSGALAVSLNSAGSKALAGSVQYNHVDTTVQAGTGDATLILAGNEKKDSKDQNIDESLTVTALNDEDILNVAASAAAASKDWAFSGQVAVNHVKADTKAQVQNTMLQAKEKSDLSAKDQSAINAYSGNAAVSLYGSAVGLAVDVNLIDATTHAEMIGGGVKGLKDDTRTTKGDLSLLAQEASTINNVVAGGGVANNTALTGSASGNKVTTDTEALLKVPTGLEAKAVTVDAENLANLTIGTGALAVGNKAAGAAIGVADASHIVRAQAAGDAAQQQSFTANALTVRANNVLNGKANPGSDTTAKNVAIGAAGGAGTFGAAGSLTLNLVDLTTEARLGAGKYVLNGNLKVDADTGAHLFGMAGGLALSGSAAVGAALDTALLNIDTEALTDNGATVTAADVAVTADSLENLTSVGAAGAAGADAFAGAGAAGAHKVKTKTIAAAGTVAGSAQNAKLTATRNISITAADKTDLSTVSGAASASGGGAAGLSAAVEVVTKDTKAYAGKGVMLTAGNANSYNGSQIHIKAVNTGTATTAAAGLTGGAAGGLAGTASETIADYTTKAFAADGAVINLKSEGGSGDTLIQADSSFTQGAGVGGVGIGSIGIGLADTTVKYTADTEAYLGKNASRNGGETAKIAANNTVDLTSASVGGGFAGATAVNGSVDVNDIRTQTKAFADDGAQVKLDEHWRKGRLYKTFDNSNVKFDLQAADTTKLGNGAGGVSGAGTASAGAAVSVNYIDKDTQAYLGKAAQVQGPGKVNITAANTETILNLTIQGTGGLMAGLAGAVNVNHLDARTKAYTDTGVQIGTSQEVNQLSVTAQHTLDLSSTAVGAAVGGAAIGAAVDVGTVKTQTSAYLGDANQVRANQAVVIQAADDKGKDTDNMKSTTVAAAVGGSSLQGSISIYNFDTTVSEEDKNRLSTNGGSFDQWLGSQANSSQSAAALGSYQDRAASAIAARAAQNKFSDIPESAGKAGVFTGIGTGTKIRADHADIQASDTNYMKNAAGSGGYGGVSAAGASVGVIHTAAEVQTNIGSQADLHTNNALKIKTKAEHHVNGLSTAASVSAMAAAQGTVSTVTDKTKVLTKIGDMAWLEGGSLSVENWNAPILSAEGVGAGLGLVGAGAVVATADADESAKILAGDRVKLRADSGDLTISSWTDHPVARSRNVFAKAAAGSGGVLAGAVAVTNAKFKDDVQLVLGKNNGLYGQTRVRLSALHEDAVNVDSNSLAAGVASGTGSDNRTTVHSDVLLSAGDGTFVRSSLGGVTIQAENITKKDWLGEKDSYHILSAGAGLAGGTGIVNHTTVEHTAKTLLGKVAISGSAASADENAISIDADDSTTAYDYGAIQSGAAILGAHVKNTTEATVDTEVTIADGSSLKAGNVDGAAMEVYQDLGDEADSREAGVLQCGSIGIGTRNDADITGRAMTDVWGLAGYAGLTNHVSYTGTTKTVFGGTAETAAGDIRIASGRSSSGTLGEVKVKALGDILNMTVIPISAVGDPTSTATSRADLQTNAGSTLKSDRDIYLQSAAGTVNSYASGYIKDWAHDLGALFGSKGGQTGQSSKMVTANAVLDGVAETGSHRQQSLLIGGSNKQGQWTTRVTRSIGVGYSYSTKKSAADTLSARRAELVRLLGGYSVDPAAKAAYQAELEFVQAKMVAQGLAVYEGGQFVLLDAGTTHNLTVNDTVVQLGDIYLEGNNITGHGTLSAPGNGSLTITNNSPNNLVVGNVLVSGKRTAEKIGKDQTLQTKIRPGGTILLNESELTEKDRANLKIFGLTVTDKSTTARPGVLIQNTFQPMHYPGCYVSPTLTLSGDIYNARGSVTAVSQTGDVYNRGMITANTVSVAANQGDFIQSYSNRIANIGGTPNEAGTVGAGSGILANGNIFISARYVNINGTIQSGVADYEVTIPETPTFYYLGSNGAKHSVGQDQLNAWAANSEVRVNGVTNPTVYVANASGNATQALTYDYRSRRLVVDGIASQGGHVSIVGTIINTSLAQDGHPVGQIKALDGYGNIRIKNESTIDLELKNISTGEGVEGKIEITDLDRESGRPWVKSTYSRQNGKMQCTVEQLWAADQPWRIRNHVIVGNSTTYNPAPGTYYVWQTGQDKSVTTTYHLVKTKADWWGTKDKTPTKQDILDAGGKITGSTTGQVYDLPAGTMVTNQAKALDGHNNDNYYNVNSTTYTNKSEMTRYESHAKRLWYTLGIAKKYDIWMDIKDYNTTVTKHAVKASNPIGISFIGEEANSNISVFSQSDGSRFINSHRLGNVYLGGTVQNDGGSILFDVGNLWQDGGTIRGQQLSIVSGESYRWFKRKYTGDGGSEAQPLQTSVGMLDAKGRNIFLDNGSRKLTLRDVSMSQQASLSADGGIAQDSSGVLSAQRVDLKALQGAIQRDDGSAIRVKVGSPSTLQPDASYGLKAVADGNINIMNTANNLYLDSVTSRQGSVTLRTTGRFIDNNFTGLEDETAAAALLHWADAQVLAGAEKTIAKQKDLLIAKVQEKYNKGGSGWTEAEVRAYIQSIRDSKDQTIYGNASLKTAQLSSDRFLTQAEKAEALVGSAKSAQNLLVSLTNRKDTSITDTNPIIKGTPHVTGTMVELIADGIGAKSGGLTINLSDPAALTRAELLALSSADAEDFHLVGNSVKVSTVNPIAVQVTEGSLKAAAQRTKKNDGSIYLVTEGGLRNMDVQAGGEVRIKAHDDLDSGAVKAGGNVVLESGYGSIRDMNISLPQYTGLTTRAKGTINYTGNAKYTGVDSIISRAADGTSTFTMKYGGEDSSQWRTLLVYPDGHQEVVTQIGGPDDVPVDSVDLEYAKDATPFMRSYIVREFSKSDKFAQWNDFMDHAIYPLERRQAWRHEPMDALHMQRNGYLLQGRDRMNLLTLAPVTRTKGEDKKF